MSAAARPNPRPPHRSLEAVRQDIDAVDQELLSLVGKRLALARDAAAIKGADRPPRDPQRVEAILATVTSRAATLGVDVHAVDAVWRALLEASGDYQDRTMPSALDESTEAPPSATDRSATSRERIPPVACTTMTDVRRGVDALDETLVAIVAERQRYMEAAARIKPTRAAVRDPARIEEVVSKVLQAAAREGLSGAIAEPVWRILIERCIAHELVAWDAIRPPGNETNPAQ